MATNRRIARQAVTVSLFLLAVPLAAAAQAPAQQPSNQGPMIVERVENGFAIVPEFKVTRVNHSAARLAGAYGGWVIDNTLLIGGGGYWLTNRTAAAHEMVYGGAVVEWLVGADQRIGFDAKSLLGVGEATLSTTLSDFPFDYDDNRRFPAMRAPSPMPLSPNTRVRFRESFLIAEPQADLLVRLTCQLHLNVGVGYRLIGDADGVTRRLRGVSGSVALQIGGFSK